MAQTTVITDDIDGSPADETVEFSIDGKHYEIDLTQHHAGQLRGQLSEWIQHARKAVAGHKPVKAAKPAGAGKGGRTAAFRQWLRDQGYEVADRGRLRPEHEDLRSQFEAETGESKPSPSPRHEAAEAEASFVQPVVPVG